MPITSRPDHVAVAVPAIEGAIPRWRDQLGAGRLEPRVDDESAGFATCQLQYRNGVRLELLESTRPDSFVERFVRRFGAQVHHVTLTVPDLLAAVEEMEREGHEIVDVDTSDRLWHQAFLRPSQSGGVIVQLAWSAYDTDGWIDHWRRRTGWEPERPAVDGAILHGPTLEHTDLDDATKLWTALGADVATDDTGLTVSWPDAALGVRVEAGSRRGPRGLRFSGTESLPPEESSGPAVLGDGPATPLSPVERPR